MEDMVILQRIDGKVYARLAKKYTLGGAFCDFVVFDMVFTYDY